MQITNLHYIPIIVAGILVFLFVDTIYGDRNTAISIAIIYTFVVAFLIGQIYNKTRKYKSNYL
ncbi:MAG: hypothetical protein NWF06_10490 [Candidatus Bathyarchaeota archaeon]|nr:hypothetical protein [Candidatus Bathyarchaeum sp.]